MAENAMIFDTHAHYNSSQFDEDREALLASLKENGVGKVTVVTAEARSIEPIAKLTEKYDFIYGTMGLHPDEIGSLTDEVMGSLEKHLENPKIVAVGEIGLDYYWDKENHEKQKEAFRRQIELARQYEKPIVVHSRDAAKDTLDVIKETNAGEMGGIIHCFSYSPEIAKIYVDMGFYIGVGGVVTFKNSKNLKETVRQIPLENIVLETDCPYLAPVPHRGERNWSGYLNFVAQEIAELKGMSAEEVIQTTWNNALKVYGIEG